MDSIMGIEIYPMISLLIFFIFFTILILWVVRSDKGYNARMASVPLEDNEADKVQIPN